MFAFINIHTQTFFYDFSTNLLWILWQINRRLGNSAFYNRLRFSPDECIRAWRYGQHISDTTFIHGICQYNVKRWLKFSLLRHRVQLVPVRPLQFLKGAGRPSLKAVWLKGCDSLFTKIPCTVCTRNNRVVTCHQLGYKKKRQWVKLLQDVQITPKYLHNNLLHNRVTWSCLCSSVTRTYPNMMWFGFYMFPLTSLASWRLCVKKQYSEYI